MLKRIMNKVGVSPDQEESLIESHLKFTFILLILFLIVPLTKAQNVLSKGSESGGGGQRFYLGDNFQLRDLIERNNCLWKTPKTVLRQNPGFKDLLTTLKDVNNPFYLQVNSLFNRLIFCFTTEKMPELNYKHGDRYHTDRNIPYEQVAVIDGGIVFVDVEHFKNAGSHKPFILLHEVTHLFYDHKTQNREFREPLIREFIRNIKEQFDFLDYDTITLLQKMAKFKLIDIIQNNEESLKDYQTLHQSESELIQFGAYLKLQKIKQNILTSNSRLNPKFYVNKYNWKINFKKSMNSALDEYQKKKKLTQLAYLKHIHIAKYLFRSYLLHQIAIRDLSGDFYFNLLNLYDYSDDEIVRLSLIKAVYSDNFNNEHLEQLSKHKFISKQNWRLFLRLVIDENIQKFSINTLRFILNNSSNVPYYVIDPIRKKGQKFGHTFPIENFHYSSKYKSLPFAIRPPGITLSIKERNSFVKVNSKQRHDFIAKLIDKKELCSQYLNKLLATLGNTTRVPHSSSKIKVTSSSAHLKSFLDSYTQFKQFFKTPECEESGQSFSAELNARLDRSMNLKPAHKKIKHREPLIKQLKAIQSALNL